MIESIKEKLWLLLEDKSVSLVMIYNLDGEILWHRGRCIIGRTVREGENFCQSYILKSLEDPSEIDSKNVSVSTQDQGLSPSAERLLIKSVFIFPVDPGYYLYVDSGNKIYFNNLEKSQFQMLAGLLGEAIQRIRRKEVTSGGISGESLPMERVKNLVLKFSLEEDCVLLLGETGVGKSHVAELIHHYSGRKGNFVVADTSTINENLFESVIFGHKKGAFTGATEASQGLVDEADRGTLFFDEISEVPVSFQSKLLRFIETHKYRKLGEPKEKTAHVRIVAATNRDLPQMIKDNQFRKDLFFRLNILEIKIPPLRERREDIRSIIKEKQDLLKGKQPGPGFWEAVREYDWPGNYRELFTVLKRAGILCDHIISGDDIRRMISRDTNLQEGEPGPEPTSQVENIWRQLQSGQDFWQAVKAPFTSHDIARQDVKMIMERALHLTDGKYIDTLEFFNLPRSDYKKFIKFLHYNKII
jgi:DNA-binding NtrC family response regulator